MSVTTALSASQTTTTPTVTPASASKDVDLNASHRCDTCGAQAFVLAIVSNADLYYCGHHFSEYEEKLTKVAQYVSDQRHKINLRASASSPD